MPKQSDDTIREFIRTISRDLDKAALLLDENPDLLNARCIHNATVLHYLATDGCTRGVDFLARRGADVNAKNHYGEAPLIDTCILGDVETSKVLLAHGANPNALSSALETPIICAVRSGVPNLVELLINNGADPEYRTPAGKTIFDVMPLQNKIRLAIYRLLEKYSNAKAESNKVT